MLLSSATRATGFLARAFGRAHLHRANVEVGVEHAAAPHFLPVVILGVDPEDRHRGHLVLLLDLLRQRDRRDRLEQRVDRPAEQSGLLAGDDGDGFRIGEPCARRQRGRRRVAGLLLRGDRGGQRGAIARMLLGAGDRRPPGLRLGRIAGEEVGQFREVVDVVDAERPGPRRAGKIDRQSVVVVVESAGTASVLLQTGRAESRREGAVGGSIVPAVGVTHEFTFSRRLVHSL